MGRQGHIDATVVLVCGDADLTSWPFVSPSCPDLAVVDRLARLQLLARRLGCRIRLQDTCPELDALLDLVGLTAILTGAEPHSPSDSGVPAQRQV